MAEYNMEVIADPHTDNFSTNSLLSSYPQSLIQLILTHKQSPMVRAGQILPANFFELKAKSKILGK